MAMTIGETYEHDQYGNMTGYEDMVATGDASNDVFVAWSSIDWAFNGYFMEPYEQDWIIDGGAGNDHLTAGDEDDVVSGGAGNDTLYGLDGEDSLSGGEGDDVLYGGAMDDYLSDTSGNNVLHGGDGNDELVIWGFDTEDSSNLLYGDAGNDELRGGDGDDSLDGGTGNDKMVGGEGDDTYFVDSTADTVTEAQSAGIDTVVVKLGTYTLGTSFENLSVDAGWTKAASAFGNDANNQIRGGVGNDLLDGRAGNDFLDGGAGNDMLYGGIGNDTYVVSEAGDQAVEWANAGTDTVQSFLSAYTMTANVENLQIFTAGVANATGNSLSNQMTGNLYANTIWGMGGNDSIDGFLGNDMLYGGDGNDTLEGNFGSDWLFGDAGNDTLSGSQGIDYLYGGLGGDTLRGGTDNDFVHGQDGSDTLYGDAGNDALVGGTGKDQQWGGAGADNFRFLATADSAVGSYDILKDFQHGVDKIDLSAIDADATVAGNQAFHLVAQQPFFTSPGDLYITEANGMTSIWADSGDGTAGLRIDIVGTGLGLTSGDFIF